MEQSKSWSRLDNAAKIFPPNTHKRDTKVFRFTCELTHEVDEALLQQALLATVDEFPLYRAKLRKGLFWYYLEESGLTPQVEPERQPALEPLYNVDRPGLLFRVNYFGARINLEVFHALTDGTGAMHFLRTLVLRYLLLRHPELPRDLRLDDYDASITQKGEDSFFQYYDKDKAIPPQRRERAYRVRGSFLPDNRLSLIEGVLSTSAALDCARARGASLGELMTAVMILALHDGMAVRDHRHPVVITVPVDLRRYFPAQTARNFFGVIPVSHYFRRDEGGGTLDDVLASVKRAFGEQLTPDNLLGIINRYSSIENNIAIKSVPLVLKIPSLRAAGWWAEREDSAAVSNIGRATMPDAVQPYVRLFNVFSSTNRPQICLCSYLDALAIGFTSPLHSTDVQRSFFRQLTELGLDVTVSANLEPPRSSDREVPDALL